MISILLKSSVVLISLLAFYKIFLEKESFFALNRMYLLVCLGLIFLIPFISLPQLIEHQGYLSTWVEPAEIRETTINIPAASPLNKPVPKPVEKPIPVIENKPLEKEQISPILSNNTTENIKTHPSTTALNLPTYSLSDWLLIFYFFGVLIFSFNLISQVITMLLKVFRNKDKIVNEEFTIVNMDAIMEPCSFFQYIFINPTSYDFDTYEQIIAHEKIHVKKGHTIDLMLVELAVIALWFNPFIWLFRKEVEKNIEFQTDALLVNNAPNQKEGYQMSLLKIATYNKPLTVVTNYNQSLIKQRILKMNAKKSHAYNYWKYTFILPLLFALLLFLNKPNIGFAQNIPSEATGTEKAVNNTEESNEISAITEDLPTATIVKEVPAPIENFSENNATPSNQNENDSHQNSNTPPTEEIAESDLVNQPDLIIDEAAPLDKQAENPINNSICDQVQAAAKAGQLAKVKELLLQYSPSCYADKNVDRIGEIDLIKDLVRRDADIFLEEETGNITIRGLSWTIWSDARHKAYKNAHNQSNINNPIIHPELDQAIKESNELQAIDIIKNLDAKYLVYQAEENLAHLKYMKYILNNKGRLTTNFTTIYIKHDEEGIYIKEEKKKNLNISYNTINAGFDKGKGLTAESDCKQLIQAARTGNISQLKNLLQTIDPNCIDPNPGHEELKVNDHHWQIKKASTPLVAAARKGQLEAGEILVLAGAKINKYDKEGETPLIAAAYYGHLDFVKYLLSNGADLKHFSSNYGTAFIAAANHGHIEVVEFLLSKGAKLNFHSPNQGTALVAAANNGHTKTVEFLLSKGADIDFLSPNQGSALVAAANNGHTRTVEFLLSKGADIDFLSPNQGSALVAAANNGHKRTVEFLLSKGADIDFLSPNQGSALVAASNNGHTRTVEFLLSKGADIDFFSPNQGSALVAASNNGHRTTVEFLLSKGADIDFLSPNQGSALVAAANNGHTRTVEFLLKKGATIDFLSPNQGTALVAAANNGHLTTVKFLLSKGAKINQIAPNQGTALIAAANNGHSRIVKYLIDQGADTQIKVHGRTALMAATNNGHTNTAKYLQFQE